MNISWHDVRPDVNVLIGINGVGKTTILNLIYDFYAHRKIQRTIAKACEGNPIDSPIYIINSLDETSSKSTKKESLLLQRLYDVVNQNGKSATLFDYRMQMINYPERRERVEQRLSNLYTLVDEMFAQTSKRIDIDKETNRLIFHCEGQQLTLSQLSSGEKQLLLLLLTVFLMDEKPAVLLLDEPEISLHIAWQDKLISTLRQLNPNCQLIITTHSPNIIANGWENNVTFVEQLEQR